VAVWPIDNGSSHIDKITLRRPRLVLRVLIRTRGTKFKLVQHHCHYDLRKYNFTNRVILIWNSLPNFVVSAGTINTFKNRLDKFWSD